MQAQLIKHRCKTLRALMIIGVEYYLNTNTPSIVDMVKNYFKT